MVTNWDDIYDFLQPKPPLYVPEREQPSIPQKVFLRSNAREALFGGAAGGGKSSALLMAALQYVDVPGYSGILFRRTYADLALPGALMDRFIEWIAPHDDIRWNSNTYTATFPSGARITFGYLNNKDDYLRYKGAEFQFVGMDEVTEIREFDYTYMFSRLRRPKTGPLSKVPIRMRAASNPAPNWVRDRFIDEELREDGIVFVPSFFTDNPGVDQEEYRASLENLSEIERRQLLEGDWWASNEGSMFDRTKFIVLDHDELPPFSPAARYVRFWDLAGSKKDKKNPDPDYSVGLLAVMDQGRFYILDVERFRKESAGVEAKVASCAHDDGVVVSIRMEQEPGASGKSLISQYSRNVVLGYDFEGIPSSGDKETRAKPVSAAVSNGNVYLLKGRWNGAYLDEVTSYPESATHDDQVDATSGAYNFLTGIDGKTRRKARLIA